MTDEELLYTIEKARGKVGLGRTKFYEYLNVPGGIPVIKLGRASRIHRDDLIAFADRLREEAARGQQ